MEKKINQAKVVKTVHATASVFGGMSAGIGLVAGIEFGIWYAWVLLGLGLLVAVGALFGLIEDCEVEEDV